MGRPIYPYELGDPDFSWLVINFNENFPYYCQVEDGCLPVVFIGERLLSKATSEVIEEEEVTLPPATTGEQE